MMTAISNEGRADIQRVEAYEASVRGGVLSWILRTLGRTAAFASVYRRIGPRMDTWLMRRFGVERYGRIHGLPSLLLTTTGAKTKLPRSSPLLYVRDGGDVFIVGTNFGQAHHPAWTNNILQDPRATIAIGPERLAVVATQLDETEFAIVWPRFVAIYPGYAGYLERCGDRAPRMFRLRAVGSAQ